MQDKFFQIPETVPGDIVIIGITDEDIEKYGPYQTWDRTIMASALEALARDPKNKPASVAVDVQYMGTTTEEADKRLADAAANLGCVVTATTVKFDTKITFGSKAVTIEDYAIVGYEEPYDELKASATLGHINALPDKDGVLRHAVLYVDECLDEEDRKMGISEVRNTIARIRYIYEREDEIKRRIDMIFE